MQNDHGRVAKKAGVNAMAGMAATAIYFLSRIALTPLILHFISLAEFGLWSICFLILSYAAVGAVGINNAYIKFTAQYQAAGETDRLNALVSTGFACMLLFAVLFYGALQLMHPWLLTLFNVAPESRSLSGFMIMGTTLVFCIDFTMGGFRSILEGLQEIALTKSVNVGASVFEVVLIVMFLSLGTGLKGLLYAYGIKTVAEMVICTWFVFKKMSAFRLSPVLINRESFQQLFVYVGKVQVLGAIAIFNASLGRLVISSVLGLAPAGLFEVGRKFPFTGRNISRAAFAPIFPAAAFMGGRWKKGEIEPVRLRIKKYLALFTAAMGFAVGVVIAGYCFVYQPEILTAHTGKTVLLLMGMGLCFTLFFSCARRLHRAFKREDQLLVTDLRDFYLTGLRYIALLNVIVFGFLMATAVPLLTAWVGKAYLSTAWVMILISLSNMIHLSTGPASLVFKGINRTGREFEFLILELVTALVWLPAATVSMGITGTAVAILASSGIASLFFLWRSAHALDIRRQIFVKKVLRPLWAPFCAAFIIYGCTLILPGSGRVFAAGHVVALGLFYLLFTFMFLWRWFLTGDEKVVVLSKLKPVLRKLNGLNPFPKC